MQGAIFTLKPLLLCCQTTEGRGDQPDDVAGECVPREGQGWSLPADEFAKFLREEDHVEKWLDKVDVERGETAGPLFGILGQPLVRVGDAVVEVADFVVVHVAKVSLVEVLGQTFTIHECKLLLDVVNARVDGR